MTVWLIPGGRHGERENFALENSVAVIGWEELPDLSGFKSRDELSALMAEKYPDAKERARVNWVGSVWPFAKDMRPGDLVAMPLKNRGVVVFGEVTGDYFYAPNHPFDAKHSRPVSWAEVKRFLVTGWMRICWQP